MPVAVHKALLFVCISIRHQGQSEGDRGFTVLTESSALLTQEMESKVKRRTVKYHTRRRYDLCAPSVLAHRPFEDGISLFFFFLK